MRTFLSTKELREILHAGWLIRFLRAADWDTETAEGLVSAFWKFLTDFSDCLERSSPSKLENIWKHNLISCAAFRDTAGRRLITIHRMAREIRCLAALLNGAVPLWIRSFQVVNHPRAFGVFFGLIKPFLHERIRDNIVFH